MRLLIVAVVCLSSASAFGQRMEIWLASGGGGDLYTLMVGLKEPPPAPFESRSVYELPWTLRNATFRLLGSAPITVFDWDSGVGTSGSPAITGNGSHLVEFGWDHQPIGVDGDGRRAVGLISFHYESCAEAFGIELLDGSTLTIGEAPGAPGACSQVYARKGKSRSFEPSSW